MAADIDDSSDTLRPVLDELYELQVEQGLPIYMVTSQTPERIASQRSARAAERRRPLLHLLA